MTSGPQKGLRKSFCTKMSPERKSCPVSTLTQKHRRRHADRKIRAESVFAQKRHRRPQTAKSAPQAFLPENSTKGIPSAKPASKAHGRKNPLRTPSGAKAPLQAFEEPKARNRNNGTRPSQDITGETRNTPAPNPHRRSNSLVATTGSPKIKCRHENRSTASHPLPGRHPGRSSVRFEHGHGNSAKRDAVRHRTHVTDLLRHKRWDRRQHALAYRRLSNGSMKHKNIATAWAITLTLTAGVWGFLATAESRCPPTGTLSEARRIDSSTAANTLTREGQRREPSPATSSHRVSAVDRPAAATPW